MDGIGSAGSRTLLDITIDPLAAAADLQFASGMQLRAALLNEFRLARNLAERARLMAELPQRLTLRRQENPVPVTTGTLLERLRSGGDLDSLFAADGPNLGATLEEANRLSGAMESLGQSLPAPVRYPALRIISGSAEQEPVLEFVWLSAEQRQALERFQGADGLFPGSVLRFEGSGASDTTWLCMDAWANRKIAGANLEAAIGKANVMQPQAGHELDQAGRHIEVARLALSALQLQAEKADREAEGQDRASARAQYEDLHREIWKRRINAGLYLERTDHDPALRTGLRTPEPPAPPSPASLRTEPPVQSRLRAAPPARREPLVPDRLMAMLLAKREAAMQVQMAAAPPAALPAEQGNHSKGIEDEH
ncbi:MAG: hypothetical protein ACO1N5_17750 [Noviherbaspirillum sp.]